MIFNQHLMMLTGSEMHIAETLAFMDACEETDGRQDASYQHADKLCYQAHVSRYGQLSKSLYKKALKLYNL